MSSYHETISVPFDRIKSSESPFNSFVSSGLFSNLYQGVNVTAVVILRIINVAIQFA